MYIMVGVPGLADVWYLQYGTPIMQLEKVTTQVPKNAIMRLRYICTAGPGNTNSSQTGKLTEKFAEGREGGING